MTPSGLKFGREICGTLALAETREWLVTNGIGGYACGTIAGLLTRCYHGLLIAALEPPVGRTLLVAKLDDTVGYDDRTYPLYTNRWINGLVDGYGHHHLEQFDLDNSIPVWHYACADALLEKRIWMQPGANTTYVQYQVLRSTQPLQLSLKALVNYRDHHYRTQGQSWQMNVLPITHGVLVSAQPGAIPIRLICDKAVLTPAHDWYYGFDLAIERERGLSDRDDHLHIATLEATLNLGETLTVVLSSEPNPVIDGEAALKVRQAYDQKLQGFWKTSRAVPAPTAPSNPFNHLIWAADQFVVNRPTLDDPTGKTILAGYPWFADWGRDTMISLPGLTLVTGRPEVARSILRTYARYTSEGMIPNRFPDVGETPDYNTVDATLWFFEALRAYYAATDDDDLLQELFPTLTDIVDWHCRGTRYNIHLDPADGLLYAGEDGVQLTWMDAKVGDWVVTPRIGKPVEVNALWYNALRTLAQFARRIGKPHQEYEAIADRALARFSRFWQPELGYCYDVLDTPNGDDASLRPNQIFAVSLPESPLTPAQQKSVVDICARSLLTSYGLRSLAPTDPQYHGLYVGAPWYRDGIYHQGTVWGWLLGAFAIAHLRVYNDPTQARSFLTPMLNHLTDAGLGTLSELFDGDAPMRPRGCLAQAWTVGEMLRAWVATEGVDG